MSDETIEAKGFMIYREVALLLSILPDAEAAKTVKASVRYFLNGELPDELTGMAAEVFNIQREKMERDYDKYVKKVKKNRKNGQTGGLKKAENAKV